MPVGTVVAATRAVRVSGWPCGTDAALADTGIRRCADMHVQMEAVERVVQYFWVVADMRADLNDAAIDRVQEVIVDRGAVCAQRASATDSGHRTTVMTHLRRVSLPHE